MGGCMSGDVKGGKQAIGGGSHLVPQPSDNNNDGGHNDAVDFFFRSHGLHPLFSQIEVPFPFLLSFFKLFNNRPK
ncbi:Protein BONZAI 3 [Linum perenne]